MTDVLVEIRRREKNPTLPQCHNCEAFDLEEGQAALASNPHFLAAAQLIPPHRMGVAVKYDAEGNRLPESEQPKPAVPQKATWADFGACLTKSEVVYKHHVCEQHRPVEIVGAPV